MMYQYMQYFDQQMTMILQKRLNYTKNDIGISSRDLAARIPGAVYCATLEQTADELEKLAQPGDMIITVGAGDIYRAGELLLKRGDAQ